jgi:peptide deformylase
MLMLTSLNAQKVHAFRSLPEIMAIRPIVVYPDPVLLRPTREVEEVDAEVRTLVEDMRDTMYAAPGVGLAANQIGDSRRICIVDLTAGEQPDSLVVLINPRISALEGKQEGEEGCLSFPEITLEIERAERITVDAIDLEGERFSMTAEGLLSRAIQHECEHLDGRVFLRMVSALKRELVKKQIRKRMRTGDWYAA